MVKLYVGLEYLLDLTSRAYLLFESSAIDEKRKLLKLVFPNLYLDGENISYTIRKPFNLFIKRANHSINLGQDVETRTFKIAQWFINNIKNIDFIAFEQNLKAIMI